MKIIKNISFDDNLLSILKYISKDSISRAKNFKNQLDKKIKNIPNMPFKARQSIHFNDIFVRDLIFKGYTIPYLIDEDLDVIVILDIFKWQIR
ncbi:type II toxin-antitoxin system RelE/ParE family toxin [Aliarcobacter skirrowii]|uniref:type II toxin-antitoxin system RelE/ParE family toxin n=1 Tax=Aliarcobacter skirrowii TaxID=28200 RepID=UPI000827081D|nr:type II toxin-antitoxin system RelE/ParE family toxin [Aliarcobacter skirrowii]MDD2508596.1 type II toxin-antitoxin system RelE/ParE family toxin [Aliarcobacter skirrowii]MDD3497199.1 type II toxin-antitoxin system RelE/ParE family toxin [Aliarcobacter skirrowii]MDX4025713.1 type II toxin-antitoxin system RelE/ParE family toxin [Aliarcobacter skirrowii]MDX4035681.1 type II toxin-antitoxin system RelE/ParE family toxin [Aliarcobacter skirrowii]MDX4037594.1 type II toxin-antitoxin system RelE